jgi:F0F1-type ATP synthase membrane subunit b/b'
MKNIKSIKSTRRLCKSKKKNATSKNCRNKGRKQHGGAVEQDEVINIANDVASEIVGDFKQDIQTQVDESLEELQTNVSEGLKELQHYFDDNINEIMDEVNILSESLKEVMDEIVPQIAVVIRNHDKELLQKVDENIQSNNKGILKYINEKIGETKDTDDEFKKLVLNIVKEQQTNITNLTKRLEAEEKNSQKLIEQLTQKMIELATYIK